VRRLAALVVAALAAACASRPAPRVETRVAPPTPTPTAAVAPTPAPGPAPVPTLAPPSEPLPREFPTAPQPSALPTTDLERPLIRVLLERGRDPVRLPQPGRAFRVSWDGGSAWVWGPLEVTRGRGQVWQVGAYSDAAVASAAASRLRSALGPQAEVFTEPSTQGLVRVRARWVVAEPADPVGQLERLGFAGAFAVPAAGGLEIAAAAGGPLRVAGEVLLEPAGEWPTAVGSGLYRGRLRARAVGDEVLLVNELNLESYLRGVVPGEMGPYAFPELEALKAQAVAARTYAVAHLGDHDDEGYDLCDTPACQVYDGVEVEHQLTDRAVAETAGVIAVHGGEPIDAMYTSTCGGHTEDAARLFPDRAQPYLKGVRCAWERSLELEGTGADGGWQDGARLAEAVALAALGVEPAGAPNAAVERLAARCGGSVAGLPGDPDADAFASAVLEASGLAESAAVLVSGSGPSQRLVALADLLGVTLPPPTQDRQAWRVQATLATLELAGALTRDRGEAVPRPEGVGIFPRRATASEPLPAAVPLWERWGAAVRPAARLAVRPGTTLERVRRGDEVVALVVERSGGDGEADRRSAWRSWVRERTWDELAAKVGVPDLVDLQVTARGVSGRVVGLTVVGRSGTRRELTGFPIRRALDLPENLFTFHRVRRGDGTPAVRFIGRGWGHGIGLCQNGAFGLARAGMRYEQILATYYSGVELARWTP